MPSGQLISKHRTPVEREWDALPRPLPEPKAKTKLQRTASDLEAGNKWQSSSVALDDALKEMASPNPDMPTVKRIIRRVANLLAYQS